MMSVSLKSNKPQFGTHTELSRAFVRAVGVRGEHWVRLSKGACQLEFFFFFNCS